MNRRQLLKLHTLALWYDLKDRAYDLANVAFPIFVVSGLIVASIKFWWWVL